MQSNTDSKTRYVLHCLYFLATWLCTMYQKIQIYCESTYYTYCSKHNRATNDFLQITVKHPTTTKKVERSYQSVVIVRRHQNQKLSWGSAHTRPQVSITSALMLYHRTVDQRLQISTIRNHSRNTGALSVASHTQRLPTCHDTSRPTEILREHRLKSVHIVIRCM